ncbi:unnamed protein product [Musa acuminata subsp. malaccensis]|uniref:(wild Malaysian banana) hypothetical protein n=1 Tax=Musa acuminata subsp. malaccensis TaxID=214687 RepID=A0A804JYL6_MUSAM|nr:PREDICTED: uncharacterized protein LOC103992426 isoform X1 [Musa acuminata subsp. malaccensis]CAG1857448.1 unnamed protein product [Musa acuminata subsp. malaccensis]
MTLLGFCCCFFLVYLLIVLISFVVDHAFRDRGGGASQRDEREGPPESLGEKEESCVRFKFQHQISNYQRGNCDEEPEAAVPVDGGDESSHGFSSEKDFRGFMEEPKAATSCTELDSGEEAAAAADDDAVHNASDSIEIKDKILPRNYEVVEENGACSLSEEFSGFDSETDSISMSDGYSVHDLVVDSDGFLSERDFDGEEEQLRKSLNQEEEEEEEEADDRLQETTNLPCSHAPQIEFTDSSDDDLDSTSRGCSPMKSPEEVLDAEEAGDEPDAAADESEKKNQFKVSEDEEYSELELLWEHQDLIEQLRMELRRARDIGLPTILEESESPRTVEDLKPLKMDESFLHEDPLDELHRAYRSYRERMRKFDILNYQKMYAIGFLQVKDPLRSLGPRKTLALAISSILSQSFWSIRRKPSSEPSDKFIKELQSDLEVVYVGQTCLSWEFLRWQYEKARELPESDPYRSNHFNQVAGEFQQFQVVIQRFVENETFQGPRLPNYIRNRCVLRNLLQVPLIREDGAREKMEDHQKGCYDITSEMIEDVMEESIRIFWEFVKADKDETPGILKGFMGAHVDLQDPSDFDLMEDIQSDLRKKEKKLKDIVRTGNCIVKKFKRPKEDRSNQDLFFSQVDLKLVARVLRMSTITTDQLVWCHKKLSKIRMVERKIYREPSFLLFPC